MLTSSTRTPGSGFVPAWAAVIYGIFAGALCNYATRLKFVFGIDDALDIWAVHAVGGFTGNILTAFFAAYATLVQRISRARCTNHHAETILPHWMGTQRSLAAG